MDKIIAIAEKFNLDGKVISAKPFGGGHINSTYLVTTSENKYLLQRINTLAFNNPNELMSNIVKVTEHLQNKGVETLSVVKTKNGENFVETADGCFRVYRFIPDTIAFVKAPDGQTFRDAGRAFGEFSVMLKDFDAKELFETIKDFHNTPKRFNDFLIALEKDVLGRAKTCESEIEYIISQKDTYGIAIEDLKSGKLPYRVTHNDTKLNNILLDKKTLKPRAVIDLDTVMAGSIIYDFGDAIRTGASTAEEDERDLEKVNFDKTMFIEYATGFCSVVKGDITERELELLPYGAYLMTMECGMRFLADYLEGDIYYSISRPEHNLDRCRTQIKLAKQMQESFLECQKLIKDIINNHIY